MLLPFQLLQLLEDGVPVPGPVPVAVAPRLPIRVTFEAENDPRLAAFELDE